MVEPPYTILRKLYFYEPFGHGSNQVDSAAITPPTPALARDAVLGAVACQAWTEDGTWPYTGEAATSEGSFSRFRRGSHELGRG